MREMRRWSSVKVTGVTGLCVTNLVPLPGGSFASSVPESDLAVSLSLGGRWLFLLLPNPLVGAFATDVPVFAALVADASAVANAWACGGGVIGLPPVVAAVRFGGLRRIAGFLHLDLMIGDRVLPCVEGVL